MGWGGEVISIIAAMDKNGLIGKGNDLPWKLPSDLAYFKKITDGNTVVMGRKTYESIGHPLPNRKNIVLSRTAFTAEGVEWCSSLLEIFDLAKTDHVFIIGGAEIFKYFLPFADRMYLTRIQEEFEGDTYFPSYNIYDWIPIDIDKGIVDEKNLYEHYFVTFERKQ